MKLAANPMSARVGRGLTWVGLSLLLAVVLVPAEAQMPGGQAPPPARAGQAVRRQAQKAAEKPAQPAAQKPAAQAAAGQPQGAPTGLKRRDPFRSLLMRPEEMMAGGQALPPGKRGLVIAQVMINGFVATPTERIAVASMAGRNRAYFLREGDELFNGYVSKITEDGVVFKEKTMDAFGREYEREVVKQLTTGSGAKR